MTGLDCLREEMAKRGCTKSQIKSKTVGVVLDILSGTGTVNADCVAAEEKLESLRHRIKTLESNAGMLASQIRFLEDRRSGAQRKFVREMQEYSEYIAAFNKSLEECETPEARDRLRAAQIFVNTVEIKTAYDNTAYINWLGALLAGNQVGGLAQMKKLNPKLFEPSVDERLGATWEKGE